MPPGPRYLSAIVALAMALLGAAHRHAHQPPPAQSYSGVSPTNVWLAVCIGGWLLAVVVAYGRGLRRAWNYAAFGWIFGPFALPMAALVKAQPQSWTSARSATDSISANWLAGFDQGDLPPIKPVGVIPVDGESFFYERAAQYGQTYQQRVSSGASPALYVPLGLGFRGRVGGYRGASQNVNTFTWGPMGIVYLSNLRIVFKVTGSPDIAVAAYNKVLSFEAYRDGLGLQVEGVGTMRFQTDDATLGALFQRMVDRRSRGASAAIRDQES